jgi:cytochrome c peroxidase
MRAASARSQLAAAGSATLALLFLAGSGCGPRAAGMEERSGAPEAPEGFEYVPPEPGSYDLPPIQEAADGEVIDAGGASNRLFDYLGDRYVLLSFIYTRCGDARGCPLATGVLQKVHRRVAADEDLADRVRLVTLSFDPARDHPEVMRRYASARGVDAGPEADADSWAFLTTASDDALDPILEGYGQSIVPEVDPDGRPTGQFAHVLKVFLIDPERRVRNIYSTSFLHPALVINDLETLLLEEDRPS